ncbi:MAG: hypothetical protein IJ743_05025, partial [Bacilli bacterium]|nr:hypothetical protein [Bacilli bacterium]
MSFLESRLKQIYLLHHRNEYRNMRAEENGLQQLFEFNKSITEQEIRKEYAGMKREEVEFHSPMSDYVLKT